ncbi:EVE domain-containing protein [Nibrella viscosa]|uniref:EVE domain-containing protein n=1 Tax=Nibrella viscosa TaxID=1084524 RepID=A0ABP8JWD4_9BACT
MAYWLIKSPFRTRTWARVVAAGRFHLYGIRNAQARQYISQMQTGDQAVFYFQQKVWGIMRVALDPKADPTSDNSSWLAVDFEPIQTLEPPVEYQTIKSFVAFADSPLVKQPRLSVVPLNKEQWRSISAGSGLS